MDEKQLQYIKALAAAQLLFSKVDKSGKNPRFGDYDKYEDVHRSVYNPLKENNITFYHKPVIEEGHFGVKTIMSHVGGGGESAFWPIAVLPIQPSSTQDQGKGVTYGKRQNLKSLTGLSLDGSDDDDGEFANKLKKEKDKQDKKDKQNYKIQADKVEASIPEAVMPWSEEDDLRASIASLLPQIPPERQKLFWISLGVKEVEEIPVSKLSSLIAKLEGIVAEQKAKQ